MHQKYFDKLIQREGYFQLNIDKIEEFYDLVRPEKSILYNLMSEIMKKNQNRSAYIATDLIFRGHANSNWSLVSSYDRFMASIPSKNESDFSVLDIMLNEQFVIRDFRLNCDEGGIQIPSDTLSLRKQQDNVFIGSDILDDERNWFSSEFEELTAFAQHYGLPTRLLDWSHHPLVACYFAVSGVFSEKNTNKFSIWVFNNSDGKYADVNEKIQPVKVPTAINQNAANQMGCFTYLKPDYDVENSFNSETVFLPSLEKYLHYYDASWRLLKLDIDTKIAFDIFYFCSAYNFNAIRLFKGAHGAAKHAMDIINSHIYQEKRY